VKDGLGLRLLMQQGIEVVIVSGRPSPALERRARELGVREIYQGVDSKKDLCVELLRRRGLGPEAVCAMGDDLPDLGMFAVAGMRIAVADAVPEVREAADHVTALKGGRGAVREACEWLLKHRGVWKEVVAAFRA